MLVLDQRHLTNTTLNCDRGTLVMIPSHAYRCSPILSLPFLRLKSQGNLKHADISYKLCHSFCIGMKRFGHLMTPLFDETISPRISVSGQWPETSLATNRSLGTRYKWPSHELCAPNCMPLKFLVSPTAHEPVNKLLVLSGMCVLTSDKLADKDKIM